MTFTVEYLWLLTGKRELGQTKKIICTSLIYSLVITGQLINPSPVFINFFSNEAGLGLRALLWLSWTFTRGYVFKVLVTGRNSLTLTWWPQSISVTKKLMINNWHCVQVLGALMLASLNRLLVSTVWTDSRRIRERKSWSWRGLSPQPSDTISLVSSSLYKLPTHKVQITQTLRGFSYSLGANTSLYRQSKRSQSQRVRYKVPLLWRTVWSLWLCCTRYYPKPVYYCCSPAHGGIKAAFISSRH